MFSLTVLLWIIVFAALMAVLCLITEQEWWGFKRHEGDLFFFGFHVWGTILPRLGKFWHPCMPDGEPLEMLDGSPVGYEREAFVAEWFGRGIVMWASSSDVRRRNYP